jgi:hypothetical protein
MKKYQLIIMIIAFGTILSNCNKKNDTSPSTNNSNLKSGTYPATGSITLTANGVNYSIPMKNVQIVSIGTYSIIINAQDTTLSGYNLPYMVMEINSSTSAITTGTYAITGTASDAYTSISYFKTPTLYIAKFTISGSIGTINITTLTSTTIIGTFSGTVVPQTGSGSNVSLINGVINCTY